MSVRLLSDGALVDSEVENSVREYLNRLCVEGLEVSFGVIFGSYANGRADCDSDIDLIVVSPEFDRRIERQWINKLWHIAARTDSRIEPLPCGKQQWNSDTSSAIIEIARTQGQTVEFKG